MKPGVLQQLTKSSQSWISLGDAYVANMAGFLAWDSPSAVTEDICTASDQTQSISGRKGLYFVCSRLESYHRCLIVSSAADLVCVFHNAILVNDF